ncbi:hypothetical protein, partial [Devosia sp. LC5]|uniref:hypothetical protein n=1 Tax=Devosia sp. LC5 TaxID=1502724 RepID=UPI001AEC3684
PRPSPLGGGRERADGISPQLQVSKMNTLLYQGEAGVDAGLAIVAQPDPEAPLSGALPRLSFHNLTN